MEIGGVWRRDHEAKVEGKNPIQGKLNKESTIHINEISHNIEIIPETFERRIFFFFFEFDTKWIWDVNVDVDVDMVV